MPVPMRKLTATNASAIATVSSDASVRVRLRTRLDPVSFRT